MSTKVKLIHTAADPVRLSFPDIFEATQYEGKGAFRFNASFILKDGGANHKKVMDAIKAEAKEEFKGKADSFLKQIESNSNKNCYVSGDLKEYEGYAGNMVLSSHRKREAGRPLVIDQNKNALSQEDGKPYAGCYVNATVSIYAQSGQNPGIRAGLEGIQFAADGDGFSGTKPGNPDDFDEIAEGADADNLA